MCGILGVVGHPDPGVGADALAAVLRCLDHRGPDASRVEVLTAPRGTCVLGHTRLRIIDVSPAADQPLPNEDGSLWVAYNGELYNHPELRAEATAAGHTLRSTSDTECLVHLYEQVGADPDRMLTELRGMFAFALWDAGRSRLLVARDRLGIKPMWFAEAPGRLVFGSEARAVARLLPRRPEPDSAAVASYLLWGVVGGGRSLFAGVRELPPGSYLLWEEGRVQMRRWWRPEPRPEALLAQDAPLLLRAALADAVTRHLVADRPVGLFLSGGADSGAILRLAARRGPVRALTVTFPEDAEDEGEVARLRAREAGAEHVAVPIRGAEVGRALPDILTAMDQPTSDGVNTWVVAGAARQAGLVVVLSGVGGDELFGGYPSFRLVPRVRRAKRALAVVPAALRREFARASARRRPGGPLSRVLDPSLDGYAAVRCLFGAAELGARGPEQDYPRQPSGPGGGADAVMLEELSAYLPRQLLRDTDQMSMAHSLEVRVPLLDDTVVRVALALPSGIRCAPGKALLRQAVGTDGRTPKRPFTLPFERWLRGPLAAAVEEGLSSEELAFSETVPAPFRRRLWEAFRAGRTHWSRPWAVAVLRLWPAANGFDW